MRVEASGHACEHAADYEPQSLVTRAVDAHCLSRQFVLTHRNQGPADTGKDDVAQHHDRNHRQREHPDERGQLGDCAHAPGPTHHRNDRVRVVEQHLHDYPEAERGDAEIVGLETEYRQPDEQGNQAGDHGSGDQPDQQDCRVVPADAAGHERGRVRADAVERGVAKRELPGVAVDEVQAQPGNGDDPGKTYYLMPVRVQDTGQYQRLNRDEAESSNEQSQKPAVNPPLPAHGAETRSSHCPTGANEAKHEGRVNCQVPMTNWAFSLIRA